jgi:hypothetical protein
MADEKNGTSPEFAKLKRDAVVPEVTPVETPSEVGDANSQQFNQGKPLQK